MFFEQLFMYIPLLALIIILVLSLKNRTEGTSRRKYIMYLISYILVYPFSYPLLIMLGFATESPNLPDSTFNLIWGIFATVVTLIGAFVLNFVYKNIMQIKKNNRTTWLIFLAHIILIPLTYIGYNSITYLFY